MHLRATLNGRNIHFFETFSENFAVLFVLNQAIDYVVDSRDEGLGGCFTVAVDHEILKLTCAFVAAERDLLD